MKEKYKDWWFWTFWISFIYCIWGFINTLDTYQRWKWGYYSLDAIPYVIILFILSYINTIIRLSRIDNRIKEIEGKK